MRMTGSNCVRATAWSTANFTSKQWISIKSFNTTLTIAAICEISTAQTVSTYLITKLGMSVTFAPLTAGEIPKTWLTLVTLSTICVRMTFTLTRRNVAIIVQSTNTITITCFASFWSESIIARCTFVTLPSNYIRFTLTLPTEF